MSNNNQLVVTDDPGYTITFDSDDFIFPLDKGLAAEMRGYINGWDGAICKVMVLLSKSSILSPTQKKLLWKEVKALKGM